MLTCLVRLVAAGQTAELHQGAVAFRLFSSMRPDDMHGTNKKAGAWDQVLCSAQSSPEKLRDIIDTLWRHCKLTNTAPPLEPYNELLQICRTRHDHASIQKLVDLACDTQMHFNSTTHHRLQSSYTTASWQYFFPPGMNQSNSSSTSSTSSSSTTSSSRNNGQSNGPIAAGVEAGASVHGGYVGFLPDQQQVCGKQGTLGTHGGRMDD